MDPPWDTDTTENRHVWEEPWTASSTPTNASQTWGQAERHGHRALPYEIEKQATQENSGGDDCEGERGSTLEHREYSLPTSRYIGYTGYTYVKYRVTEVLSASAQKVLDLYLTYYSSDLRQMWTKERVMTEPHFSMAAMSTTQGRPLCAPHCTPRPTTTPSNHRLQLTAFDH